MRLQLFCVKTGNYIQKHIKVVKIDKAAQGYYMRLTNFTEDKTM